MMRQLSSVSKTLDIIEVKAIGLWIEGSEGSPLLGIGWIFAVFQNYEYSELKIIRQESLESIGVNFREHLF